MLKAKFKCNCKEQLKQVLYEIKTGAEYKIGLFYKSSQTTSNSVYGLISQIYTDQINIEEEPMDIGYNFTHNHSDYFVYINFLDDGQLSKTLHRGIDKEIVNKCNGVDSVIFILYFTKNELPNILDTYNNDWEIIPVHLHELGMTPDLVYHKDKKKVAKEEKKSTIDLTIDALTKRYNTKFEIKKVIFNGKATIVMWNDGTKTISKWNAVEEVYDPEKGLAMCFVKKALGNRYGWWDKFIDIIDNAEKINIDKYIDAKIHESINSATHEYFDHKAINTPKEEVPIEKKDRSCNTCVDWYNKDDGSKYCVSCQNYSAYREYKEPKEEDSKKEELFKVIITNPDPDELAKIYQNMDAEDDHNLVLKLKTVKRQFNSEIIDCMPDTPYYDTNNTEIRRVESGKADFRYTDKVKAENLDVLYCNFWDEVYGEFDGYITTKRYTRDARMVIENPFVPVVYKLYILEKGEDDTSHLKESIEITKGKFLIAFKNTDKRFWSYYGEGILIDTDYISFEGTSTIDNIEYYIYSINVARDLSELDKKDENEMVCAVMNPPTNKPDFESDFKYKYKIRKIYDNRENKKEN